MSDQFYNDPLAEHAAAQAATVKLQLNEMVSRVQAVLAVHQPAQKPGDGGFKTCVECDKPYPCTTVRLLKGASE